MISKTRKTGLRKVGGRRIGAVRRRYGRRVPRPLKYNANRVGGPNTCRITQTLPTVSILANTPYRISVGGITGERALAVCEQFALYRISKVVFKYKPHYDTFIPQNQGPTPSGNFPTTVPLLYWKMNRFADNPAAWALDDIKAMGAKPIRFDDKSLTVAYKPNILLSTESGGSDSGQVKMTPWLNTDRSSETAVFAASTTEHYGHFYYVDCNLVNNNNDPAIGSLDVTIYYEFKNPRVEWTPASEGAKPTVDALKITDISGTSL